jgi:hypothetical protein
MMGPTLNGLDPMFELSGHFKTGTHTRQAPQPPSPSPPPSIYLLFRKRKKENSSTSHIHLVCSHKQTTRITWGPSCCGQSCDLLRSCSGFDLLCARLSFPRCLTCSWACRMSSGPWGIVVVRVSWPGHPCKKKKKKKRRSKVAWTHPFL